MWLVSWLTIAAFCAPTPWYGAPPLEGAWWTETDASPSDVRRLAKDMGLRQVVLKSATGAGVVVWTPRRDHLDEVDGVTLDLLSLLLRVEDGVGVEMDMLGPAGGSWRGLTATWSVDGVVAVQQGPPLELMRPLPMLREDLQSRYGLGAIVDHDLAWTPHELGMLGAALATLNEEERARVAGVSFDRVIEASGEPLVQPPDGARFGAMTVGGASGVRVEVLQGGLISGFRFVGPVERPAPFALFLLVHELAHVIAVAPDIARVQRLAASMLSYDMDRAKYAAAVAHYNEQVALAEAQTERQSADNEQLYQVLEELELERLALEARRGAIEAEVEAVGALDLARQPAAGAWVAFLDGRPAPTLYGRLADAEGFADAFALWKLDPEALERAVPGAVAWFDSGAHLDVR